MQFLADADLFWGADTEALTSTVDTITGPQRGLGACHDVGDVLTITQHPVFSQA